MYNLCETFHCLPRSGGLLDQDSLQVYLFSRVSEAVAERQERDSKRAGKK